MSATTLVRLLAAATGSAVAVSLAVPVGAAPAAVPAAVTRAAVPAAVTRAAVPAAVTRAAVPAAVAPGTDYCVGQCLDILPPGANGNATLAEILAHRAFGTRPAHSADQLDRYADLVYNFSGLTEDQVNRFFNDASLGVPAGQVERAYAPRGDVRIVRDKATGVPRITGTTRAGTMFGAGYAGAEDRLFVMDVFRHVGRGELTPFAGGGQGNRELEQTFWRNAPYTEADLRAQIDRLRASGPRGQQLYDDVQAYLDGVNSYIARCLADRTCPGEYVLAGHLDSVTNQGGPKPFGVTDLIAIGAVIGGLFGGGGGTEMQSALVRLSARARYGDAEGDRVWQAFRAQNDPETVLTLHSGQSFPYGGTPANPAGVVLPDPGTATVEPIVANPTGSAGTANAAPGVLPGMRAGAGRGMSNAVVVSGAHSTTGNPIAVFGPQAGYFVPQLLMLQELRGPGIHARGVSFSGLNFYVQMGRGPDYSWSATSSHQDLTDTFAVELCDPTGAAPRLDAAHYRFRDACLPMEKLVKTNTWRPSVADSTPAGSYELVAWRTRYGTVTWRGTVAGKPTAFTSLRSTYRHEVDSAIGFQMFNEPDQMGDAAAFQRSTAEIGYAFNWFYVNSRDAAYAMSGLQPVRRPGTDPNLPIRADRDHEWAGWDPESNTADYVPFREHPTSVNQDYYVSWNNKATKDHSAADGNFSLGAVQRAELLDRPVRERVAAGGRFSRADVVALVERAAVADLRGVEVLDDLLRVLKSEPITDPTLAAAAAQLEAWHTGGALRREAAKGDKRYRDADAIRIMDAWWPLLVRAEFRDGLGDGLYRSLVDALSINESPSGGQRGDVSTLPGGAAGGQTHKGSSFQYGWWGFVEKDLRAVLGDQVPGWTGQRFCGGGDLAGCRRALLDTLRQAAAQPATEVYPGDAGCAPGDQWCADTVGHSALGGITVPAIAFQNRPTYQQVVSFPAGRGDDVANLAAGRPVSASSTQPFFSREAAVDGDRSTRWSSNRSDDQWITVDLGVERSVSRVILRWEAAYASGYRIEVSTDGANWHPVAATGSGDGDLDTVRFAPTRARYVRMAGVKRATGHGYSLWEFEVYSR